MNDITLFKRHSDLHGASAIRQEQPDTDATESDDDGDTRVKPAAPLPAVRTGPLAGLPPAAAASGGDFHTLNQLVNQKVTALGRSNQGGPLPMQDLFTMALLDRTLHRPRNAAELWATVQGITTAYRADPQLARHRSLAGCVGELQSMLARVQAGQLDGLAPEVLQATARLHDIGLRHYARPDMTHVLVAIYLLMRADAADSKEFASRAAAAVQTIQRSGQLLPARLPQAVESLVFHSGRLSDEADHKQAAAQRGDALSADAATAAMKRCRDEIGHYTEVLLETARPLWRQHFPHGDAPATRLPHLNTTHLGTNALNHQLRKAKGLGHDFGALLARVGANRYVSPSIANTVRKNGRIIDQEHQAPATDRRYNLRANLSSKVMTDVRCQILDTIKNAPIETIPLSARKAAGQIRNTVRDRRGHEPDDVVQSRAGTVAALLDLSERDSPINSAIEALNADFARHGRSVQDMSELEYLDFVMNLSATIVDKATEPTKEETERAAVLIEKLAPELKRKLEEIHLRGMRRAMEAISTADSVDSMSDLKIRLRHPIDRDERVAAIVRAEVEKTSRRIGKAVDAAFDKFREDFGYEFGYNEVKTTFRRISGMAFYHHQLKSSAEMGAGLGALARLATLATGATAGPWVQLGMNMLAPFITNTVAQTQSAMMATSSNDYKPFETSASGKAAADPQTMALEHQYAKKVDELARKAAATYADPENPSLRACAVRVAKMRSFGYDDARLLSLAPELHALAQLDLALNPEMTGLDDALAPVRVSMLLHKYQHALPDLNILCSVPGEMSPTEQAVVIDALIRAMCGAAGRADLITDETRAQVSRVARETVDSSRLDEGAFRRSVTPGEATLRACGTEFIAVIGALMRSTLRSEKELFSSATVLKPQYKGLTTNALLGLSVLTVVGVAGIFAIGAATATAGPAGTFGAGLAVTAAGLGVGYGARTRAAKKWGEEDWKGQTNFCLFSLMRPEDYSPFLTAKGRAQTHEKITSAFKSTHTPLLARRKLQLQSSVMSLFEDQCIKTADVHAKNGFAVCSAVESSSTGGHGTVVARLAELSTRALHTQSDAAKHDKLLREAANYKTSMADMVQMAKDQLQPVDPEAYDALRQKYDKKQSELWALQRSLKFKKEQAEFMPTADGKPPVHARIDQLRTMARDLLEPYIRNPQTRMTRIEWEGVCTALRLSHADSETEAWIERTLAHLQASHKLVEGSTEPLHLAHTHVAHDPEVRKKWIAGATKLEERMALMGHLINDALNLEAGNWDAIVDPTGTIRKHLKGPTTAFQESKYLKLGNGGMPWAGVYRGIPRTLVNLFPTTVEGAFAALIQYGALAVQVTQIAGDIPGFKILEDVPAYSKTGGISPNFPGFAQTLMSNLMPAMQPSGNPVAFAMMNHLALLVGGYSSNDPMVWSILQRVLGSHMSHAFDKRHWGPGSVDVMKILQDMTSSIGTTKFTSLHKEKVHKPGHEMTTAEKQAWKHAVKKGKASQYSIIWELLHPGVLMRDMNYGKHARKQYDKVTNDRHNIAANMYVVAQTLDEVGSAALPPVGASEAEALANHLRPAIALVLAQPAARTRLLTICRELGVDVTGGTGSDQAAAILAAALRDPWLRLSANDLYRSLLPQDGANAEADARFREANIFSDNAYIELRRAAGVAIGEKLRECLRLAPAELTDEQREEVWALVARTRAQIAALHPVQRISDFDDLLSRVELLTVVRL